MDKQKVLHITKHYPPYIGGTEALCHDTCSALKNDCDQLVFAFNDKKETVREVYDGVEVIRVGLRANIASQPIGRKYGKLLYETIRDYKPDIIHFDYPNPYGAHYFLKAIKKLKWNGKFILFWVMDIIKQKKIEWLFRKQTITLINKADIVQMLSPVYNKGTSYLPYYKKDYRVLAPRVGDARLVVTSEQKKKANQIREENKDKTICFFYGRHVEYKGIKYIIEANNYIDKDKFIIYIGGMGPLTESLKEEAKDMKNIIFLGRMKDDDINSYLLACDIFLFPSITRNEAYGISQVEAMWFGKPPITFTIPGSGVNWVSIKDETGLEVENSNAKAYAEAMNKLRSDKALYNKLSKNAYERAHKYFSIEYFNASAKDSYFR